MFPCTVCLIDDICRKKLCIFVGCQAMFQRHRIIVQSETNSAVVKFAFIDPKWIELKLCYVRAVQVTVSTVLKTGSHRVRKRKLSLHASSTQQVGEAGSSMTRRADVEFKGALGRTLPPLTPPPLHLLPPPPTPALPLPPPPQPLPHTCKLFTHSLPHAATQLTYPP